MAQDVSATEDSLSNQTYFAENVWPGVKAALDRGAQKYKGRSHWRQMVHMDRTDEADVRHVRECHVAVRLAEAEDATSLDNSAEAQRKLESAIGYLLVLHRRIHLRQEEKVQRPVPGRRVLRSEAG